MQETWIQSLGQEDPLEKGMATHSNFLSWRTPWSEEPGGLQYMGLQGVGHDWITNIHTQAQFILCESIFIPLKVVVNSVKHIFIIKKILKELTWDFPGVTVDKNPPADAWDTGSMPGLGRFHMLQSS